MSEDRFDQPELEDEEILIGENIANKGEKVKLLTEEELEAQWSNMTEDEKKTACYLQKMSVDFVERHKNEIYWPYFSLNPNLTMGHLDAFANKISWVNICNNAPAISENVLYNYATNIKCWELILQKQQLDTRLLIVLTEKFKKSRAAARKNFFKAISRYQKMDVTFIKTYKRYLDPKGFTANPHIKENILEQFLPDLDLHILLKREDLSKEFFVKYADIFSDLPEIKEQIANRKSGKDTTGADHMGEGFMLM